jgi:hypothetical protein
VGTASDHRKGYFIVGELDQSIFGGQGHFGYGHPWRTSMGALGNKPPAFLLQGEKFGELPTCELGIWYCQNSAAIGERFTAAPIVKFIKLIPKRG